MESDKRPFDDLRSDLVAHLRGHALKTDGPFRLSSGGTSSWYLDGRQTTYDGRGARLVGGCVAAVLDDRVTAIGGLTMGADPVAIAAAIMSPRPLKSFSIRKEAKTHGTGGRLVGPLGGDDVVAVVDDTSTTGSSFIESIDVLAAEGIEVVQAIVVVDRSGGTLGRRMAELGVPYRSIIEPADLGVDES